MAPFSLIWSYVWWGLLTYLFLRLSSNFIMIYIVWRHDPEAISFGAPSLQTIALGCAIFIASLLFLKMIQEPEEK